MTNTRLQKRKAPQYFITILFIFSFLAGVLSSCNKVTNSVEIGLTPTVENPATEELTLVPETEVATQMPTIITLTSEPTNANTPEPTRTKTPEPTPTATEIPEKHPIDLGKLSTTPKSYQYLLDHKEEFVKGPDPLEEGMEEFFKWYLEKLIPSLGDYKERDGNIYYNQVSLGEERFFMTDYDLDRSFKGQMEFWYFEHGGVVFPVLEIAGIQNDGTSGYTVGVVLVETLGNEGLAALEVIKNKQREFSGVTLFVKDIEIMPVSEDVHKILEKGFFYYNGREHYFGLGAVFFKD